MKKLLLSLCLSVLLFSSISLSNVSAQTISIPTGNTETMTASQKQEFIQSLIQILVQLTAQLQTLLAQKNNSEVAPSTPSSVTSSTNSITVLSPKAGDVWQQGKAYTVSWTPYKGDFDEYDVQLSNKLVPGVQVGELPQFVPISKSLTSITLDSSRFFDNDIKSWLINAQNLGLTVSEQDLRKNFYYHVQAVNEYSGKSKRLAQGDSGIFSIVNAQASEPSTFNGVYSRNLTVGDSGLDVTALQNFLVSKGFTSSEFVTGYFGPQLKAALALYQLAKGISPADGYFGPVTRSVLNSDTSVAVTSALSLPSLISLGGNNASPNEKIAVYISSFPKANSYTISFSGNNSGDINAILSSDGSYLGFTVPNFVAGQYNLTARGHNSDGSIMFSSQNTLPFTISGVASTQNTVTNTTQSSSNTTNSINITSPSSSETLNVGQTYRIKWTSSSNIDKVSLGYSFGEGSLNWFANNSANNISNQGYYDWNVNIGNTTNTSVRLCITGYQTGVGSVSSCFGYFKVNPSTVSMSDSDKINSLASAFEAVKGLFKILSR
ncbi:MAG: peptidoglycan-binding domain-containing protein [Candidatus Paceibacterota bacterium]